MKPREKNIVNKIKVQERIWEIIINGQIVTLSIDKKSKKSEIYVSLLFNKLEPASGSRGA